MLSNDANSFHLKKGRFTEFIDGRLPMDRERKYYNKEKDSDPTIRMSACSQGLMPAAISRPPGSVVP